jgi:cysteine desulfurase/selenocysteine lyase
MLDTRKIKKQFPIFKRKINGKPLVYLDSASTSQKPQTVIDSLVNYYTNTNANIHRSIYKLSEEATSAYENVRAQTAKFINVKNAREIIFTKNATESINLVAQTWGKLNIKPNDEIIVSILEHHSNLVPWQQICKEKNAKLKIIPLTKNYSIDLKEYKKLLSKKTKLVAITGESNVLGTRPPLKEIIKLAHKKNAITIVDGAQMTAHSLINVQDLDCDFFVFSSHKVLGPTGVGVLYGKENLLEKIPPFLFGGDMIKTVSKYNAEWNNLPWKFEAGTPNIADVIAFGEALNFLTKIGIKNINEHNKKLLKYTIEKFSKYKEVKLFYAKGSSQSSTSILSFSIKNIHPHDIAQIFDTEGVEIRSGHHCCKPLMDYLKVQALARISFYLYNTFEDIDLAEKALKKTLKIFK